MLRRSIPRSSTPNTTRLRRQTPKPGPALTMASMSCHTLRDDLILLSNQFHRVPLRDDTICPFCSFCYVKAATRGSQMCITGFHRLCPSSGSFRVSLAYLFCVPNSLSSPSSSSELLIPWPRVDSPHGRAVNDTY